MNSNRLLRSLVFIIIISSVIAKIVSAQSSDEKQQKKQPTADSTSIFEKQVNQLVNNIVNSIETEYGLSSLKKSVNSRTKIDSTDSTKKYSQEIIMDGSDSTITYHGETIIGVKDTIKGNIVVRSGSLTIKGYIAGNVKVVDGNIEIQSGAFVSGDITCVRGKITKVDNAIVEGFMLESTEEKDTSQSKFHKHRNGFFWWEHQEPGYRFDMNWLTFAMEENSPFIFRYNRVDGLFLGFGKEKEYPWETDKGFSTYGSLGYGFALHRWRGNIGTDVFINHEKTVELGGEYHNFTDTKDNWLIPRTENIAAALLIHEDYFDYYTRRGFDVHWGFYPIEALRTRVDYLADNYESLPWKTDWSLFGGSKHFRPNPVIDDGRMRSIAWSVDYLNVDANEATRYGWNMHASGEYAGRNLKGDFNFNRYILDVRQYQQIGDFSKLSGRVRIGTSSDSLPLQKTFEFGGVGTLPAFPYKDFQGNRMCLLNLEYLISGWALEETDFFPLKLLSPFSVILFTDAGWVNSVPSSYNFSEGFNELRLNNLKNDVGFAIGSHDGQIRLGWAWRTDRSEPGKFFFRISRPF